ncbi:MAG: SDR family oxidoreductase [Chromatiales bacterium]|nr:SDR family oxidoreductase [Chromatiales bacterium]
MRKPRPASRSRRCAADITTAAGRAQALAACPDPDILVNNAAGPPPGDFRDWTRADWIKALDANMLTPIELIKATVDGMIARRFGRIVNITSGAVKAPIDIARACPTARAPASPASSPALARQTVRAQRHDQQPPARAVRHRPPARAARGRGQGQGQELRQRRWPSRAAANPAGRLGEPLEFGELCAYLCSAQAGYITGQNILIDGGAYPGTF